MSMILNIDTAVEWASICLSRDGESIQYASCEQQKEQASWLHPAIKTMMEVSGFSFKDLSAIAVTIGPGSYTGLRIGLSAAKGLCYTLNIPIITVGTLEMMAFAVKEEAVELICPMIDARRMEVYTAIYDRSMNELLPAQAMVLSESSFKEWLPKHSILFTGNGFRKSISSLEVPGSQFSSRIANASNLAQLSHIKYDKKLISDPAYSEPLYIKDFHFGA
ncbi:MAG TPA: tRNA (adenosine(37)-N6)-threonylcarbamoyltransferase complex dimerization subunit type 1 TsaB [Chitinophagaceae bacterium]|nr:tRNA (adenosine(37)-N6)-threonylcarbamoyltransferase complex dimerization subunit type 1 TsaB [Chitinophagaceae bacterium]